MTDELQNIAARYKRRQGVPPDRYSHFNPAVMATVQERQRALVREFTRQKISDLSPLHILEVGCGSGGNLLELIQLGAEPKNLVANDLLPERVALARARLPATVNVTEGDASQLGFQSETFDLVYQSTVFSSILDDDLQFRLANAAWRWLRPGGAVLWYDFVFNNPRNPDVRGVPVRKVRELFPDGQIFVQHLTLAPPLARRVVKVHPSLYGIFNAMPFLRTHVLCYIKKS